MKLSRLLLMGLLALTIGQTAKADEPFRLHRYDAYKAIPRTDDGKKIIFFGNSITNMHEWWEGFGSDPNVCNRGNSGGFAYELIENVESVVDSKPAKVFIGIGTNDLNSGKTPAETAQNIRILVKRIHISSPNTQIYVQSILPRNNGISTEVVKTTDALLKAFCEEEGSNATYVDLYDTMIGLNNNKGTAATSWTNDGLHPSGIAYRAWVDAIKDKVNDKNAYQEGNNVWGGMSSAHALRCSQFGLLPIAEDDAVIFGDEMIHGGEWHELLGSDKVKGRGTGWGYGGITLANAVEMVRASLKNNSAQKEPKKIFLYYGVTEANNASTDALLAAYKTNYISLVDSTRKFAPNAQIYIMSLLPTSGTKDRVQACNTYMKAIADSLKDNKVEYIDIYTPFANTDETQNTAYFTSNYLYAKGYNKLAEILSKYIDSTTVISEADFQTLYDNRTRRNSIGSYLNKLFKLEVGENLGQFSKDAQAGIDAAIEKISKILSENDTVTADQVTEAGNIYTAALAEAAKLLNQPTSFTESTPQWFRLVSSRGSKAIVVQEDGTSTQGSAMSSTTASTGEELWKFVKRTDGTFDIINNRYGTYLSPTSPITATAAAPTNGWDLSYSNYTTGTYTLSNGTSQINQSNSTDVLNWGYDTTNNEPNRTDQGCSYSISEFTGSIYDGSKLITSGYYYIDVASGLTTEINNGTNHLLNADEEYLQNSTNSYALSIGATPATGSEAKAFIKVTVSGSSLTSPTGFQFTAQNGHGINPNCTSNASSLVTYTTSSSLSVTASDFANQTYAIGKWSTYTPVSGGTTYVGQMSTSNNTFTFTRVADETLAKYDIWTVTTVGATAATLPYNDTKVSIKDVEGNAGITTVYNGGQFFVPAGTTLTADNFTVTNPTGVTLSNETPVISLNPFTKTIYVDYNTTALAAGWHTINFSAGNDNVTSTQSTTISPLVTADTHHVINADTEYYQKSGYWYPLCIGAIPTDAPAKAFVYITRTGSGTNDYAITAQNGHGVNQYACASRDFIASDHVNVTASNGLYNIPYWSVWTGTGNQFPYVGRFSSSTNYFDIQKADVSAYDIYTVNIIAAEDAAEVANDAKVTLTSEDNKGLSAVYNNGAFFVTAGATISESMLSATTQNDKAPEISINNKTITVDYTTTTGIDSLITTPTASKSIYDLSGRKVSNTQRPGFYIIDGQKTLVK